MENNAHIIRVPITRLDTERHMAYGYASTGSVDAYDTIFDPSWWPYAISGYLQDRKLTAMHEGVNVGNVPIIEINERGLWIGAEVTIPEEWEKIESGEYNGFSIEAYSYASREEEIGGRKVLRLTKYILDGITIGYPIANLDAKFQLIERLEYDDSSPWDWDWGKDADAIVDQLGWKGLKQACLYQDPDADSETKKAYKLPVAKMKGGKLTVFWNGVRAAMAALNGARGGLDITESARKTAYNKLKTLYKKFDKEIPELRLENGGNIMSAFTEKVVELLKKLSGKDPDESVQKEIGDLETRLADEKTKQIETLTETVKDLTGRLEKIEKENPGKDTKTDDGKKAIEEFTGSVKKLEERLGEVEKQIASSQQPGEGNDPNQSSGQSMNDFIRASANRQ